MNNMQSENRNSILRLGRFLFWYAIVAAALLGVLPWAGEELQSRYEALSGASRLAFVTGSFAAVAAWQLFRVRGRMNGLVSARREGGEDTTPSS